MDSIINRLKSYVYNFIHNIMYDNIVDIDMMIIGKRRHRFRHVEHVKH
jgi:hypothetical protein